ncbi:MAG: hypothetical protein IT470_00890 [Pseudomonadales bacterium]|nr:hypothetical protein [Pseudomonadales bacterium]
MNSSNSHEAQPKQADNRSKRNALLGELESIRNLLDKGNTTASETTSNSADKKPSTLVLEDGIPTLNPEPAQRSQRRSDAANLSLQAIRQATAKVAAQKYASTMPTILSSPRDREKLVDDVVRSALPRIESILRELVQEALLQEKLRNDNR